MADAAAELDEGGIKRTLKDLFAGAAGGIAQVLLGQFVMTLPIGYFHLRLIIYALLCYLCCNLKKFSPGDVVSPVFEALCRRQEKVLK